jgi:hypothetical protein
MRGLMSRFFPNGANPPAGDPPSDRIPASWRDETVEDPFEDLRIRQRMAELIVRAALRDNKAGA